MAIQGKVFTDFVMFIGSEARRLFSAPSTVPCASEE